MERFQEHAPVRVYRGEQQRQDGVFQLAITVSFHDSKRIKIECYDRDILESMKMVMHGRMIRGQMAILVHYKASPKLILFRKYPINFAPGVLDFIKKVHKHAQTRILTIDKIKKQYGHQPHFDYEYKGEYEKPLEHQKIMFNGLVYTDACALLADPGTCKTGPYLWAIDKRIQRGQVKRALVVTLAPLKENVLEEMGVQVPHLRGVAFRSNTHADNVINKKYKQAKSNKDYDIYITNYESMFKIEEITPEGFFDMVILDEAHRAGNPQSRQTKALIDAFDFVPYKYIITATLHANNLISFFMPFRFLGPDTVPFAHWVEFRRRFMHPVDPDGHIWKPSPGSITEVTKITGKISILFKKEDCLDLPPLITERVTCDMAPKQRKLYDQMKEDLVAVIEDMCSKCNRRGMCDMSCRDTVSAKNALVLLTKLRQICCGFYINTRIKVEDSGKEVNESNVITLPENPKLDLLMQTISCIPEDKKLIIWTTYVHAIKLIYDRLCKAMGEKHVLTCHGSQNAYAMVQKFKEPQYHFMVAMESKMGVGQNMQYSNYQAFFNNSYSSIQREQALGRQHRQGQKEKVTVFDLLARNSIDEIVLATLYHKKDLAVTLSRLSVVIQKGGFDPINDNVSIPLVD